MGVGRGSNKNLREKASLIVPVSYILHINEFKVQIKQFKMLLLWPFLSIVFLIM